MIEMGRGKQYDRQKMLDLYKEGNSYEEIADKCQIKSVQSVRHAIEKWLKEDRAEKENKKLEEEEERKKIEKK